MWLPVAARKRRAAGDDSDGLTSFDQHTAVLEQCAQCGLRTRPLWIRASVAQAASEHESVTALTARCEPHIIMTLETCLKGCSIRREDVTRADLDQARKVLLAFDLIFFAEALPVPRRV